MKNGMNRSIVSLITAMVITISTTSAQPNAARIAPPDTTRIAEADTVRIARLLKAGSAYVLRPGNEKSDLDSALFFLNQALTLSESIRSDKWINAALEWKGDCYLEGNDLTHGQACFQQVIDYSVVFSCRRYPGRTGSL
jgi:hypothetical protein